MYQFIYSISIHLSTHPSDSASVCPCMVATLYVFFLWHFSVLYVCRLTIFLEESCSDDDHLWACRGKTPVDPETNNICQYLLADWFVSQLMRHSTFVLIFQRPFSCGMLSMVSCMYSLWRWTPVLEARASKVAAWPKWSNLCQCTLSQRSDKIVLEKTEGFQDQKYPYSGASQN